jgi:hypothetical protein
VSLRIGPGVDRVAVAYQAEQVWFAEILGGPLVATSCSAGSSCWPAGRMTTSRDARRRLDRRGGRGGDGRLLGEHDEVGIRRVARSTALFHVAGRVGGAPGARRPGRPPGLGCRRPSDLAASDEKGRPVVSFVSLGPDVPTAL